MSVTLGIDVGTSAVKAALYDVETSKVLAAATSPQGAELARFAAQPGWCEQRPDDWWRATLDAVRQLPEAQRARVEAIGIAYQMHGLVLVGAEGQPTRDAIIWADGRAGGWGDAIAAAVGPDVVQALRNHPGNFTLAKMRWVREHEPDALRRATAAMLPGDFIALRLTGEASTTPGGLSEMIAWDYGAGAPSAAAWDAACGRPELLPPLVPNLGEQGRVSAGAAAELGVPPGTPIAYRAGDQPNNALALGVLGAGEVAASAGTSGVLFGVAADPARDPQGRVNTFLHVGDAGSTPLGVLLCVNGTGALYSWVRAALGLVDFHELNALAERAEPGSGGVAALPYGNGAERTLGLRPVGAAFAGIDRNRHGRAEIARAAVEGIVFALRYGADVLRDLDVDLRLVRAGDAGLFKSSLFRTLFATVLDADLELVDTDGALGAARAAAVGSGLARSLSDVCGSLPTLVTTRPDPALQAPYQEAYARWKRHLEAALAGTGA